MVGIRDYDSPYEPGYCFLGKVHQCTAWLVFPSSAKHTKVVCNRDTLPNTHCFLAHRCLVPTVCSAQCWDSNTTVNRKTQS
jgi:hypothetical protein